MFHSTFLFCLPLLINDSAMCNRSPRDTPDFSGAVAPTQSLSTLSIGFSDSDDDVDGPATQPVVAPLPALQRNNAVADIRPLLRLDGESRASQEPDHSQQG